MSNNQVGMFAIIGGINLILAKQNGYQPVVVFTAAVYLLTVVVWFFRKE